MASCLTALFDMLKRNKLHVKHKIIYGGYLIDDGYEFYAIIRTLRCVVYLF